MHDYDGPAARRRPDTSRAARRLLGTLMSAVALATPFPAPAQAPARADSLAAEVRRLQARLDSLERVVARLAPAQRDTAQAVDELAALRAAARAAVTPDTVTPSGPQTSLGNLNRLNPEISVNADVRVRMDPDQPNGDNLDFREVEFSFQSALDPYASTKIFVSAEEEGVEVEEGYAFWSGIPGGFRLDVGRFRQQMGELNRWHSHALPESELPLVLREYTGEEGLVGDGIGLYWVAPFGGGSAGTYEVWAQGTLANNELLFGGGRHLSGLGHVNAFWQLSPAVFVQLGGTLIAGSNQDSALTTRVFGADFRVSWRPPARALYRSFTLRGEAYANRRDLGGTAETYTGAYVAAQYQLSRRFFAGARVDAVEPLAVPAGRTWEVVPTLTWWQSEWVYLRLEGQHTRNAVPAGGQVVTNRVVLQAVWAMGPHKHETY